MRSDIKRNKFDFEDITAEDFNYRRRIALSFTIEKSSKTISEFLTYRKNEAEIKKWSYLNELTLNIKAKYDFSQAIFQHKTSSYYKGLFIRKMNNEYLVITIVAPRKYFLDPKSFIYMIFASMDFRE